MLMLDQFVEAVQGFQRLSAPEVSKHFIWYLHRVQQRDRVNTADVRECYDALHLDRPNISLNLVRLSKRRPRVLLRDCQGFYLEGSVRSALDEQYLSRVQDIPLKIGDHLLPDSIVMGTRPYLEKLAGQINGCYQCKFYDGCAVLMRRLVESLLIEVFVQAGHADRIRQGNEFMMLQRIIDVVKTKQYVQLARGSDQILDDVKYVGDRAAHSRNYVSTSRDIADLTFRFRTIVVELLHLADIRATPAAASA